MRGEAPPTAGLAPRFADLFASAKPQAFEAKAAAYLGAEDFLLTCSGTSALLFTLHTLRELTPDRDCVIVSGYTCPLVVLAIRALGLRAIAADTSACSIDIDIARLPALLTPRTLAVIPAHFGGSLADVDAVRQAVRGAGSDAVIVEDAAQAFGATVGGAPAGLKGDVGFFSFALGKGLTLFEGGGLVARSADLRASLRRSAHALAPRSLAWDTRRSLELLGYHLFYNRPGLGMMYGVPKRRHLSRGDGLKAAGDVFDSAIPCHSVNAWRAGVGLQAFKRLPAHLEACAQRFDALSERLSHIEGVTVLKPRPGQRPTSTYVMALMPSAAAAEAALRVLWPGPNGVSKAFVRAIGDYPQLAGCLEGPPTPHAREFASRLITVTTSDMLDDNGVAEIAGALEVACRLCTLPTGQHADDMTKVQEP